MEFKMRGFSRRHFDLCILIDQSRADIVTEEHLIYGYAPTSISNPDFSAYAEVLHCGLYQVFCPRRAIHIDGLSTLVVPGDRHQRSKPCHMVVVKMREENGSNISDIDSCFGDSPRCPITSVNDVVGSIHNQQV